MTRVPWPEGGHFWNYTKSLLIAKQKDKLPITGQKVFRRLRTTGFSAKSDDVDHLEALEIHVSKLLIIGLVQITCKMWLEKSINGLCLIF